MKKTCILAALMLFTCNIFAAGIQDKILSLHKKGETMTTSFTEVKVMPKMKKEMKKEGTLVFTSPDNLRLDYTSPEGDYTLITATNFETLRNGKVQKLPTKNPQNRWAILRSTLLLAFSGKVEEMAALNNATAEYKEEASEYVCTLTANEKQPQGIAQLVVAYNKKTGQLQRLTVTEANGNYTTYSVK